MTKTIDTYINKILKEYEGNNKGELLHIGKRIYSLMPSYAHMINHPLYYEKLQEKHNEVYQKILKEVNK
jgi:hypothetical protein